MWLPQQELDRLAAAAPRPRPLSPAIYGPSARARVALIRSRTVSPHRRPTAYQACTRYFVEKSPKEPTLRHNLTFVLPPATVTKPTTMTLILHIV